MMPRRYNGRASIPANFLHRQHRDGICLADRNALLPRLTLRGMPVAARALMVGAHPDDEDSALLADLVLRRGVRTSYLSLTRGEGGQNCLGPEAGAALGVLRTGELMASRRYDGAEQLFSPCVDFGYAKRAEDAFATGRASMWWAASCRRSVNCSPTW